MTTTGTLFDSYCIYTLIYYLYTFGGGMYVPRTIFFLDELICLCLYSKMSVNSYRSLNEHMHAEYKLRLPSYPITTAVKPKQRLRPTACNAGLV